ncbi:hypothetical protein AgCh_018592 [Apium graveolens]
MGVLIGDVGAPYSGDKDASKIWGKPWLYLHSRTREIAGSGGLSSTGKMPYPRRFDPIEIDMGMQKVTVTGRDDLEKVLNTARRNERQDELWPAPGEPKFKNLDHHRNNDQHPY